MAGLSVAAAALTARSALQYYQVWKVAPRLRKFYEGGFQEKMDESEALKILNLRCAVARVKWRPNARCVALSLPHRRPPRSNRQASAEARVKEAHRKIMMANHVECAPQRRFALAACTRAPASAAPPAAARRRMRT